MQQQPLQLEFENLKKKCTSFSVKRKSAGNEMSSSSSGGYSSSSTFSSTHINCMQFSSNGARLASGATDKTVRLWRVESMVSLSCFVFF